MYFPLGEQPNLAGCCGGRKVITLGFSGFPSHSWSRWLQDYKNLSQF